jgi:site-specific recombinase XerC
LRAVQQFDAFLDDPDVDLITTEDIRRFLDSHLTNNSDATAKQRHGSLSVFLGWLISEGEIEANPMSRVKAPKVEEKPIEVVTDRLFRQYLDTCDNSFKGRRDFAILWLLWDTGLRLGEVTGIGVSDIQWREERVYVEGKSGFRTVPYTAEALRRWLASVLSTIKRSWDR